MPTKFPLRRLIRLGWRFAFLVSLLSLATSSGGSAYWRVSYVLGTFLSLFVIFLSLNYINIVVRLLWKDRYYWPQFKDRLFGNALTCLLGTVVVYLVHLPERWMVERHWRIDDLLQALGCGLVVSLWNAFVIAQHKNTETEVENARLKASHAQAEYRLLRQQIHPHFLFNALSILKSLIRPAPDLAEEYLLHLSGFLRAVVSSDKKTTTALAEEVQLCLDYLAMQKIRFGESLYYFIDIDPETLRTEAVLSFSLLPLLENAIKHNEVTIESPLYIRVVQEEAHIKVSNNIQLKRHKDASTGVGLSNLMDRYQLWSGDEVLVREEDQGGTFSVSIKIVQHANNHYRRRGDNGQ
jgi:two-component system LytT family sensor kinase